MILTRSSRDVVRKQNPNAATSGRLVWNTGYLGTRVGVPPPEERGATYPDVYLVEQGPGVVLPPHFHRENQFQIVMIGAGTFGKKEMQAFRVHYAGAYTPYGPITAGPEGIGYLTIRATYDPGARTMPDARDELHAAGAKPRDLVSAPIAFTRPDRPEHRAVLGPEPDGVAAWLYELPAGASVEGPDPYGGAGQFLVVLDGAMRAADGALLPQRSTIFVGADEAPQTIVAADEPLAVLALQFPKTA
jgi:hypothetical protein